MIETTNAQFVECDTCRAKPGTPELCQGCLHNRGAISRLRATHPDVAAADTPPKGCICTSLANPKITCPIHGR